MNGMKFLLTALVVSRALAQSPAPAPTDVQAAERLSQLMESTAVSVPGLARASDPMRQLASATLSAIHAAPQDLAQQYRFAKQVGAYLALSDTFPRPTPFPDMADRQFSELRDGLQRFQLRFETSLDGLNSTTQARNADPVNLARYADANSKLPPSGTVPRVVFLGDSITDAWRLNEYFTGRDFVNRGISGQTTLQMLGRFMQDVVALKPRAVLILAGTNDIAHGVKASAIEDGLAMMGELAKANNVKPLFASILPVSDYHKGTDPRFEMTRTRPLATIRQINAWLQDYCRKEGFVFVDYYSNLADGTGQIPADMADDGLHPNSKGYRAMSPVALDALNKVLSSAGQPTTEKTPKKRFSLLGH
jgi:lysophospholipase L1-like esterase